MSTKIYDSMTTHVDHFLSDTADWSQEDSDGAAYAFKLEMAFDITQILFKGMIRGDELDPGNDPSLTEMRNKAIDKLIMLAGKVKDYCAAFPPKDYGYKACPKELGKMLDVLKAMRAGAVVSRPGDTEQALIDLEQGETLDLDQFREALQARDS